MDPLGETPRSDADHLQDPRTGQWHGSYPLPTVPQSKQLFNDPLFRHATEGPSGLSVGSQVPSQAVPRPEHPPPDSGLPFPPPFHSQFYNYPPNYPHPPPFMPPNRPPASTTYPPFFHPLPSSSPKSDSPEFEFVPTPKPDKGKKRASNDENSVPSKKPKPAKPVVAAKGKTAAGKASAAPHGRPSGAANYTDKDIESLLDIVGELLPVGGNAWQRVEVLFNERASKARRPPRTHKPLKTKFESLVRTTKPTGNAELPPHIQRALEIDKLMNESVHLRTLDDDGSIADEASEDEIEEIEEVNSEGEILSKKHAHKKLLAAPMKNPVLKGFRTTSNPVVPSSGSRRNQTQEFMSSMTASLDPARREAREETRFARHLMQDDIQRSAQEIRDLRTRNEGLTAQLQEQAIERGRLQSRIEMLEMMQTLVGHQPQARHERHWDYDERRPSYRATTAFSHSRSPSPPHSRQPYSQPHPRSFRSPPPDVITRAARASHPNRNPDVAPFSYPDTRSFSSPPPAVNMPRASYTHRNTNAAPRSPYLDNAAVPRSPYPDNTTLSGEVNATATPSAQPPSHARPAYRQEWEEDDSMGMWDRNATGSGHPAEHVEGLDALASVASTSFRSREV